MSSSQLMCGQIKRFMGMKKKLENCLAYEGNEGISRDDIFKKKVTEVTEARTPCDLDVSYDSGRGEVLPDVVRGRHNRLHGDGVLVLVLE